MKPYIKDELADVIKKSGITDLVPSPSHRLEFKDLMNYRIDKILMVCSLYDFYTIVEDGHLEEAIFNEYLELNLHYAPIITRVYSGETALQCLESANYDLIIVTLRLADYGIEEFARIVKEKYPDIPIVLLASQSHELKSLIRRKNLEAIDKIFIWSGDRTIFLAIIKLFEDLRNAETDCGKYGVTCIILIEDSPDFYSYYLPLIFTEVMNQSQNIIEEGRNSAEKLLRQRARPKIFHATTYEEAWSYYEKYQESVLGIITDIKFKHNNIEEEFAGIELVREVKRINPQIPILVQSSDKNKKSYLDEFDVAFFDKNSRTLLVDLRDFMKNYFGFGDFIFRTPDGVEINRAHNLRELRDRIKYIPEETLLYHSNHNHFSLWLIARTHFELAYRIRPVNINQFSKVIELREYLINVISEQIFEDNRGIITVFSRNDYDDEHVFQVIGEGSLGGKARGLGFIDMILKNYLDPNYFPGVKINIPKTIVLGTNVFTQFMEMNNLYHIAVQNISDSNIIHEFLRGDLPPTVIGDLREFLEKSRQPVAVRSSSLLEDAMYQPFAGVYDTVMIPNSSLNLEVRFNNLMQAIKLVYASTYSKNAKNYIEATGNRIEEEKMAVILQEIVGQRFEHYYYPNFSGVAKSYNYYPFGKSKPQDGIVNLALGLGKTIVDSGISLQYSPEYPKILPQFSSTKDYFSKSQTRFWAVDLNSDIIRKTPNEIMHLKDLSISDAERHQSLNFIVSTYSSENDMLYEGINRKGPKILDFAPILKSGIFPLNNIIKLLLKMAEVTMNSPVEIEFAVNIESIDPMVAEFGFLQVRPMVKPDAEIRIKLENIPQNKMIMRTNMALGNGEYLINRVLYVKPENFNIAKTKLIAEQINEINYKLLKEEKGYMLIGPGRWGSQDPWLGIPIKFSDINSAQVIVETQLPDAMVDPSQGSHFFHNMTSFKIAYLTIKEPEKQINWGFFANQTIEYETEFIKLILLSEELYVKVDGHSGLGVVILG